MNNKRFNWIIDYTVYVKEIDEQHRYFLDIANSIFELVDSKNILLDDLLIRINKLGDYIFYHFATEEEYFKKFNYENTELHTKEHNFFREKVKEFIEKSKKDDVDLKKTAENLAEFSGDWLIKHILATDKNYISCFQIHGLQ